MGKEKTACKKKKIIILAAFAIAIALIIFIVYRQTHKTYYSPVITVMNGEYEIGKLQGFVSNEHSLYDSADDISDIIITSEKGILSLYINEEDYRPEKINYSFFEIDDKRKIGADAVKNGEEKLIKAADGNGQYEVKLNVSTINPDGGRYYLEIEMPLKKGDIRYYNTEVIYAPEAHYSEMTDFMFELSDRLRAHENSEWIATYLEPDYTGAGIDYGYVDIYDSLYMTAWGDLEVTLLTKPFASIEKVDDRGITAELKYLAEIKTEDATERYVVRERITTGYTAGELYLSGYERKTDAIFDSDRMSLSRSEFKLGLKSDVNVVYKYSNNGRFLSFLVNDELWVYDIVENAVVKLYSLYDRDEDIISGLTHKQSISLLRVCDDGDVYYGISGRIPFGKKEGYNDIMICHYIRKQNHVAEAAFITDTDLGSNKVYVNYVNLYLNDMNTVSVTSSLQDGVRVYKNLGKDSCYVECNESNSVVLPDKAKVICQGKSFSGRKTIGVYDLETDSYTASPDDEGVDHVLYGIFGAGVVVSDEKDGKIISAAILDSSLNVIKELGENGRIISDLVISGKSVIIHFEDGETKHLFCNEEEPETILNTRTTKRMLTQYYLPLPDGTRVTEVPRVRAARR